MAESKLRILTIAVFLIAFLSGCAGFSRLPEINFVGKSREEVVRILAAANPDDERICLLVSSDKSLNCNGYLYFTSAGEALADRRIQTARVIGGFRTERAFAIPGGWDYYEVVFDHNDIAVSQKISTYFDGP